MALDSAVAPTSHGRSMHLRLRPAQRVGILVVAILAAGFGIGLPVLFLSVAEATGTPVLVWLLALVAAMTFLALAALIGRAALRVGLTLSPKGVEYRALGYRVVASWSDIETLGPVILGTLSGDALTLREGRVVRGGGWIGLANLLEPTAWVGAGFDRVVPLTPFAKPLRGSALLEELRRYLPAIVARYEAADR